MFRVTLHMFILVLEEVWLLFNIIKQVVHMMELIPKVVIKLDNKGMLQPVSSIFTSVCFHVLTVSVAQTRWNALVVPTTSNLPSGATCAKQCKTSNSRLKTFRPHRDRCPSVVQDESSSTFAVFMQIVNAVTTIQLDLVDIGLEAREVQLRNITVVCRPPQESNDARHGTAVTNWPTLSCVRNSDTGQSMLVLVGTTQVSVGQYDTKCPSTRH